MRPDWRLVLAMVTVLAGASRARAQDTVMPRDRRRLTAVVLVAVAGARALALSADLRAPLEPAARFLLRA